MDAARSGYLWLLMALVAASLALRIGVAASDTAGDTALSGPLDGLAFTGKLESTDGKISLDDSLHFDGGYFWSAGCVRCSFRPGEYWSRTAGDAIEFRGTLESGERGRFAYAGEVRDGEITVTIHWRRERWYWTVERDYTFTGTLDPGIAQELDLARAESRAGEPPRPDCPI